MIKQRAKLAVSKDGIKLGYLTSEPVHYEAERDEKRFEEFYDGPRDDKVVLELDPNHSHFILVAIPCSAPFPPLPAYFFKLLVPRRHLP